MSYVATTTTLYSPAGHATYRDEKLARTEIENVGDNSWYLVAMFDLPNQNKLLDMVEPETADLIRRARGY